MYCVACDVYSFVALFSDTLRTINLIAADRLYSRCQLTSSMNQTTKLFVWPPRQSTDLQVHARIKGPLLYAGCATPVVCLR